MDTIVIASSEQDATAVEAVKHHHAEMAGTLAALAERLVSAHDTQQAAEARDDLVHWAATELLPHARAEEGALYPAAHRDPAGRLLVDGMLAEHETIAGLVEQLRTADTPVRAAAVGTALRVLFESHLAKENDLVLPLLAASPDVSVADALHGMHELLGGHDGSGPDDIAHDDSGPGHAERQDAGEPPAATGGCGGTCSCGESDGPQLHELDARAVPHAIRHATIFGALDAVRPGGGLVLVAPHDPLPLLAQVEQRNPGAFAVDYLERGPEAWRLRFLRASA